MGDLNRGRNLTALQKWHEIVKAQSLDGLKDLLTEDATFYSPIIHTPQVGRDLVLMYLGAAAQMLFNGTFEYLKECEGDHCAILEFQAVVDGLTINGVDIITWDDEQKIDSFKVMVRPLKATNMLHAKMIEMLETSNAL